LAPWSTPPSGTTQLLPTGTGPAVAPPEASYMALEWVMGAPPRGGRECQWSHVRSKEKRRSPTARNSTSQPCSIPAPGGRNSTSMPSAGRDLHRRGSRRRRVSAGARDPSGCRAWPSTGKWEVAPGSPVQFDAQDPSGRRPRLSTGKKVGRRSVWLGRCTDGKKWTRSVRVRFSC
jgi:hypothetical protein